MGTNFNNIKKIFERIKAATGTAALNNAEFSARRFVRNLSDEQIEQLQEQGLDIYGNGEEFKKNLLASFENEVENKKDGKKGDESIFSKSMDEISKMDLSQENIYKILHGDENKTQGNEEVDLEELDKQIEDNEQALNEENPDGTDGAEEKPTDENIEFYKLLENMFNDPMLNGIIDADGDGEISNEEAQEFLKNINIDDDTKNFSLNDLVQFINKAATLTPEEMKAADDAIEQGVIPEASYSNSSPAINSYNGGGGGYTGGGGNVGGSSQADTTPAEKSPEEKKADLQQQIEEYKKELSEVNSGTDSEVKGAIDDRDSAKEEMEKALDEDEKISDEQKEEYKGYTDQISEFDTQIGEVDSQISSTKADLQTGKNTLASLEAALNSLAEPTGKEEDKAADEKLRARKAELDKQIQEQKAANDKLENETIPELESQKETLQGQLDEVKAKKDALEAQMLENASDKTKEAIEKYNKAEENIQTVKEARTKEVNDKLTKAQDELKQVEDEIQTKSNKEAESNFSADFDDMVEKVFEFEGGFGNHPNDAGGATNLGITQATYNNWLASKGMGSKSVEGITKEEAKQIYYDNFYVASGADKYAAQGNNAYAFALFDAAVNHGVGGAQKLHNKANGDVGAFMEARKNYYQAIVANNPSQQVFAKGWQNRWNNVYSFIDPNHQYVNYIG